MCEMMLKGLKEALTVLIVTHVTHVKRVERLCYMLKQGTDTFLFITFLIFNRFSICKKFWKAETQTFPTIPSNAMYVEGIKSYYDFRPLRHASRYIALAFQNFLRIENRLNIKKVMSKNVFVPCFNI